MKTLKDLQASLIEQKEFTIDRLLSTLDGELGEPSLAACQYWNGQYKAFDEVAETVWRVLKHHECEYLNELCVVCGEDEEF